MSQQKLLNYSCGGPSYIFILAKMLPGITWLQMIIAFCIMIFTGSIFALLVLTSPHAIMFYPEPATEVKLYV